MLRLVTTFFALIAMTLSTHADTMDAVGRVDLGSGGFCTGTLIAPNIVLTAAHCLYDKKTGARFDASQLVFRAGYADGQSVAQRGVRRAATHPEYIARLRGDIKNLPHDVALLELEHAIPPRIVRALDVASPDLSGTLVGVTSYGLQHAETPIQQSACSISARPEGVFVTTCQASFGTSGAPVVQMRDGAPKVVSVISAMARADGRPVALAADVVSALSALTARIGATELTALR